MTLKKKLYSIKLIKKYFKKNFFNDKIVYTKELVKIFYGIDYFLKKFALKIGGEEEIYSSVLNLNTLLKTEYLKSFPQFVFFVSKNKNNLKNIKNISKIKHSFLKNISEPNKVLPPTVCHHFFETLKNIQINDEKFVTSLNVCNRSEPSGTKFLSRLNHYWMREYIFIGKYENYSKKIIKTMNWFKSVLKKWNVNFKIVVANDPFFGNEKKNELLQKKLQLKKEILVKIGKKEEIAIASFNIHQNKFMNTLNIKNKYFTSACIGFGFERIILTLMVNYGPNYKKWPKKIKKDLLLI